MSNCEARESSDVCTKPSCPIHQFYKNKQIEKDLNVLYPPTTPVFYADWAYFHDGQEASSEG